MPGTVIDISVLDVAVRQRPVLTASPELVRGHGGDMDDLKLSIAEGFAPDGRWCEVGGDLHTISIGDAEIRLRRLPDTVAWHADYFNAGWCSSKYEHVPAEHRRTVAMHVDRAAGLFEGLLQEADLRTAAAQGGPRAVDELVRHHVYLADQRHEALDTLLRDLTAPDGTLPVWARTLLHEEAEDLNMTREWLGSAVLDYHHGSAGYRPTTIFGGICFEFSTGVINLVRGPA
ncbi:hypothetical protein ACFZDJ_14080 [Streptomyces sp. NPDC007896]|uniref:hypothetical protein n=1 Tax=Streptomyces sp. NPDC007896 TaxID=3364784 RepID=UPI0036E4456C